LNFSPDFAWIKQRNSNRHNTLYDSVRGVTKFLISNNTAIENTDSNSITSFDSNGFSVGSMVEVNASGGTYVGWAWDAGTSTATNNDGSIASQVRANPSAGFSIVSYTGTGSTATVGHSLGVAPSLILCKSRTATVQWVVYHADLGKDKFLGLNTTDAAITSASYWGAGVTSAVFGLQNLVGGNNNGDMVAYCFAPVAGYSAISSYTGNGSTDGPFVYTGFKPKWVMYKRTDVANSWQIQDTSRDPDNPVLQRLIADASNAEYTGTSTSDTFDALSNGFKIRGSNNAINASGGTFIYAAFAENPFKTARAR
jgi:hypothetical protein